MRIAAIVLGLVLSGCSTPPPEAPAPAKKAEPAPKPPPPAAPIDKMPIKADLQKVAWLQAASDNFGYDDGDSRLHYWSNGTGEFVLKVPADGEYQIVVSASSQPAQNEHAKFKVAVDGRPVGAETACTSEDPKDYPFSAMLAAGERKVAVSFTNDVYKQDEYDRNFYLNGLKLVRVK